MPPTPPEEIAKQHEAALQLISSQLQSYNSHVPPNPYSTEIPLSDKVQPTQDFVLRQQFTEIVNETKNEEEKKEGNQEQQQGNQEEQKQQQTLDQVASQNEISFDKFLSNPICFSSLGHVDVSALQNLILEGYNDIFPTESSKEDKSVSPSASIGSQNGIPSESSSNTKRKMNYWDPKMAATHNVSIQRPSHDAWGIKKIVLIFCDDLLHRTYEMPWYQEFHHALKPILELLPEDHELVRLLFACVPPGVTIPVHHDTGEWVKTTHRVHVPIIVTDPRKVLFRCGPLPTMMRRVDCTPGHVFELNNQSKHAVSNCGDDCRVHLILDYRQDTSTPRIRLQPGERVVQTRRSIDRYIDVKEHPRPTPTFIILGAQKAGTTSLYEYMVQHPWVIRARRRETHCLDWRWNEKCKTHTSQLAHVHKFFFTDNLRQVPSCLTGDSTPSYLLDSRRVIPRIQQVLDHWKIMKFFVMLRNPIQRAESHYAMVTSTQGTPAQLKTRGEEWRSLTFQQVVKEEFMKMNECGLIPYWNIETETMDEDIFNTFHGSDEEDKAWDLYLQRHVPLNTGSYGILTRGMYALQLRPWFRAFQKDQFLVLRLEQFKEENGVDSTMRKVWSHLELPHVTVEDTSPKNSRDYQSLIDPELRHCLQLFFKPHNCQLSTLLGEDWSNIWDQ